MRIGVYRGLFALACLSAVSAPLRAQDLISVDVNVASADVSRKPIGINVNFSSTTMATGHARFVPSPTRCVWPA